MLIKRRSFVVGALCAPAVLLPSRRLWAHEMFEGVPTGEAAGDYGYKHDLYHEAYQRLFGEQGHCLCGVGECRVTDWRETELKSPRGYDVIVNRLWLPLLLSVWMPDELTKIPAVLLRERAHICAYGPLNNPTIACAMVNVTQT